MDEAESIADLVERREPAAAIVPVVYSQLRALAAKKMANEPPGTTLSGTALVHEAYLRVEGGRGDPEWDGCGHFYAAAAEAMRRILIDRARRRKAVKHGGDMVREEFDSVMVPAKSDEILKVHESLDALATAFPRKAELVKLRYFVGLTTSEAATVLGISVATAERDWAFSKTWLKGHIEKL
ncbi:MAG: ECF-type sigma factor [Verrucomicrobiales bacterium]